MRTRTSHQDTVTVMRFSVPETSMQKKGSMIDHVHIQTIYSRSQLLLSLSLSLSLSCYYTTCSLITILKLPSQITQAASSTVHRVLLVQQYALLIPRVLVYWERPENIGSFSHLVSGTVWSSCARLKIGDDSLLLKVKHAMSMTENRSVL